MDRFILAETRAGEFRSELEQLSQYPLSEHEIRVRFARNHAEFHCFRALDYVEVQSVPDKFGAVRQYERWVRVSK